uniref:Uncharacterized protein n=1 Tax=Chromera velia CCMP2878 TaxID=1169474 RepID=A0A0G4F8D6_9ALVE|eukprot:Cvel_15544.t1-p1 / transcript=Cvel_15544.t1 / gene=Cvel_15544 / organism=Chromera_velia_CCMP2878 / gene_product=hypothetical protein / transcript_product=hypothetical protein / location=Cvel_scaffold1155:8122-10260(-) / protein_length=680 / sequence_SO=supercontig / SO=protein_coding / is_pseudo=false
MWVPEPYSQVLALFFLVFVGFAARFKLETGKTKITPAVKDLVLSVLLPATIFVSLFDLHVSLELLVFPAVGFAAAALFMLPLSCLVLRFTLPDRLRDDCLSVAMVLCSFSPGLSSYPFIRQQTGDLMFAEMAFADFGNKIYGIFGAKLLAFMRMSREMRKRGSGLRRRNGGGSLGPLRALTQALLEPITFAFLLGLALSFVSLEVDHFGFIGRALRLIGRATTPVTLLFIGMKLGGFRRDAVLILCTLVMRVGLCFLLIAIVNLLMVRVFQLGDGEGEEKGKGGGDSLQLALGLFFNSAASFWPYAQICQVANQAEQMGGGGHSVRGGGAEEEEEREGGESLDVPSVLPHSGHRGRVRGGRLFNQEAALAVVSLSFPLSILMQALVSTGKNTLTRPEVAAPVGLVLLVIGIALLGSLSRLTTDENRFVFPWPAPASRNNAHAASQTLLPMACNCSSPVPGGAERIDGLLSRQLPLRVPCKSCTAPPLALFRLGDAIPTPPHAAADVLAVSQSSSLHPTATAADKEVGVLSQAGHGQEKEGIPLSVRERERERDGTVESVGLLVKSAGTFARSSPDHCDCPCVCNPDLFGRVRGPLRTAAAAAALVPVGSTSVSQKKGEQEKEKEKEDSLGTASSVGWMGEGEAGGGGGRGGQESSPSPVFSFCSQSERERAVAEECGWHF